MIGFRFFSENTIVVNLSIQIFGEKSETYLYRPRFRQDKVEMVPCWFRKGELHDLHATIDIDHIYPFELHPPKFFFSCDIQQNHLCDNLEVLNMRYPAYNSVFMYKCT